MNCAYIGGVSRDGEEDIVSSVRIGDGVRLGGIFDKLGRDGVGEDGDDGTGFRVGGATGMLRLANAGSLYFP